MGIGETLTRSTIWISMACYAIGSLIFAVSYSWRNSTTWLYISRALWTIACASLIAHFITAFHFYHGWSHAAAYADTARQTRETFGLNWGGGVFLNYGLLIAWMFDIAWWWRGGLDSYRKRPRALVVVWHGFLIFIIFNATVVFADGIVRWIGAGICLMLILAWLRIIREWK